MAEVFYHTCNKCGYTVRTTGNFGFYTNRNGKRVRYAAPAWRMPDDVDVSRPDNVVLVASFALPRKEKKKRPANLWFNSWLGRFKKSKNKKAPEERKTTSKDEIESKGDKIKSKGNSGFCLTAYCPACDKILDLVTMERIDGIEVNHKPPKCPFCLNEKLVIYPDKQV